MEQSNAMDNKTIEAPAKLPDLLPGRVSVGVNAPLTDDARARIVTMIDQGYKTIEIAAKWQINKATVYAIRRARGVDLPMPAVDIRRGQISRALPVAQAGHKELMRRLNLDTVAMTDKNLISAVSAAEAAINHAITPAERREDVERGYIPHPGAWALALATGVVRAVVGAAGVVPATKIIDGEIFETEGRILDNPSSGVLSAHVGEHIGAESRCVGAEGVTDNE